MTESDLVRVRGTNGAELTLTVPRPGTAARELYDARVASGALVVLADAPKPRTPKPKPTEVGE